MVEACLAGSGPAFMAFCPRPHAVCLTALLDAAACACTVLAPSACCQHAHVTASPDAGPSNGGAAAAEAPAPAPVERKPVVPGDCGCGQRHSTGLPCARLPGFETLALRSGMCAVAVSCTVAQSISRPSGVQAPKRTEWQVS